MSWFGRRRTRQTPPISLILLLVGFILVAFVFVGFRQLRGAQERRLRLVAGFGERVESTVEDLTDRFVRIVQVREVEESETPPGGGGEQGDSGEPEDGDEGPAAGDADPMLDQKKPEQVRRYLEHVPHLSLIRLPPTCPQSDEVTGLDPGDRAAGSVSLYPAGSYARLEYCPSLEAMGDTAGAGDDEEAPENGDDPPANGRRDHPRGYLARIDLESVIAPMIIPGAFDSIVLADHRGRTLFQQGEPALRMLDLGPLVEAAAGEEDDGGVLADIRDLLARQGSAVDPEVLDRVFAEHEARPLELGSRTAMVKVEIAGSDYFVFLQPVSPQLEPPPGHGAGEPVRWIAAGVISSENLLSAGLTTSPFLLFILVSILPLGIVTWPFLKLALITRRQPFRRLDLAALLFASVLGIALAALLIFDVLFLVHLHGEVDEQLEDLGAVVSTRFEDEILDAREQLLTLDGKHETLLPASAEQCTGEDPKDGTSAPEDGDGSDAEVSTGSPNLGDLTPVSYIENARRSPGRSAGREFIEDPVDPLLTEAGLDDLTYPYFDSVFWATAGGEHGCANLPLREHAVLPQKIEDRAYFRCARDCEPEPFLLPTGRSGAEGSQEVTQVDLARWSVVDGASGCPGHALPNGGGAAARVPICFQSFLDRTTGRSVAAVAVPSASDQFPVAALVTRLTSVAHPVLPPAFGFAIVEPGGRVLFHSESRRDLTENFLEASDEDPVLRALLEQRRGGHLGIHYWGQPTRVHVQRLDGLPWSLITFRNTYDLRVRNFELIYDFLNPFLLYLGGLSLLALGSWVFVHRRWRRYLWPSSAHLKIYRVVALSTPIVVILFGAILLLGRPTWIFAASLSALPTTALLAWGLARDRTWDALGRVRGSERSQERGAAAATVMNAWERRRRWLPLGAASSLIAACSFWLVVARVPVAPVLVGVVAVCVAGALAWHWNSFSGERRKVAYVFAFGCVLLVTALLPAIGFFHLARSRQAQFFTQDAQVAMARRLEERVEEIDERKGPLDEYDSYDGELNETRDRYLFAFFETVEGPAAGDQLPPWPYGLDKDRRPSLVARLLAARPFPLNDLSARPVESDLSRFDAVEGDWEVNPSNRLVYSRPTLGGADGSDHLASIVPTFSSLPGGADPETLLILLALLTLGLSPFVLSYFLAERVLLIALVGQPSGRDDDDGDGSANNPVDAKGWHTSPVASTPLDMILDEVRQSDDVVKQVVLVSALPGPDAWEGFVAAGPDEPGGGEHPLFHRVSFIDAWRRTIDGRDESVDEDTGRAARQEGEGQTGDRPDAAPKSRADRFRRELLTIRTNAGEGAVEETSLKIGDGQPLLLTHFEPALGDAEAAADQVAALRRLTVNDGRSVVILTQTVPDPEVAPRSTEGDRDARARRRWTDLLGTYAVEHGYDSRSCDIVGKACELDGVIEKILTHHRPSGFLREDLRSIQRNLRRIERECSPTPVLRNIGWSLLEGIEEVLPEIELTMRDVTRETFSTTARRRMQGRFDRVVRRAGMILGGEREQSRGEAPREGESAQVTEGSPRPGEVDETDDGELRAVLVDLSELLVEARDEGQNPVVLLQQAALKATWFSADRARRLLDTLTHAFEELRPAPDRAAGEGSGDDDEETKENTQHEVPIDFLKAAVKRLDRDIVPLRRHDRRLRRGQKLLKLFTRDHILAKVGSKARLHYRYLWSRCTTDEKLVLVQLAENGLVNPKYFGWVMDLMNRGLVVRDPRIRIMNESFRRFIIQEVRRSQVLEWQEEDGPSGWSVLKWILPAPLILVAAFLFVTQRDALSNVTGVLVAAVSLAPILVNLYGQFQEVNARRDGRGESKDGNGKEKGGGDSS